MKNSLIAGFFALSLFCPAFAWGQTKAPTAAPVEVPLVGARILLDAKKSYARGEEVVLEITLENTGRTPLRFHNWDIELFYEFDVTAGGKKIEPFPDLKQWSRQGLFSHDFIIPPQSERMGYLYLSRAFDLSKEDSYTVTVSQKSRHPEVEGVFTVTSQPFDFKVAGPPEFGYRKQYVPPTTPQPETPPTKQP